MNCSELLRDQRGSLVIEFLFYGVVLQVGLLVAGIQLLNSQSSQLVAESIARHSLRSFVISGTAPDLTANQLLKDYAHAGEATVQISCVPNCDELGAVIAVTVKLGAAKASASMVRY